MGSDRDPDRSDLGNQSNQRSENAIWGQGLVGEQAGRCTIHRVSMMTWRVFVTGHHAVGSYGLLKYVHLLHTLTGGLDSGILEIERGGEQD